MKTLVLANQKGGVGKSAVATLIAHDLRRRQQRVLAVDLDHQGNYSSPLVLSKRPVVADITADRLLTEDDPPVPDAPFVLIPASSGLMGLERQPQHHTPYARRVRAFLARMHQRFDVCIVDTNPNPDIRVIAALASADHVLSPIQLTQEAIDGVRALLGHGRVGVQQIKAVLNPKLNLIGLLPTLVEATPFQRENMAEILRRHANLMIALGQEPGRFAHIPKRSAIAEAQAEGLVLWEMKKTAARDAAAEIEPTLAHLAAVVTGQMLTIQR